MNVMATSKARIPKGDRFSQQVLPGWEPVLSPYNVIPSLLAVGMMFVGIGIYLTLLSQKLVFIEIDYTQCRNEANQSSFSNIPLIHIVSSQLQIYKNMSTSPLYRWRFVPASAAGEINTRGDVCQILMSFTGDFQPPVLLYYKISNFYQNVRDYVTSYSSQQLLGRPVSISAAQTQCLSIYSNSTKVIYPCGLIANSYFNDTISDLQEMINDTVSAQGSYEFAPKGITWPIDQSLYANTSYQPSQIAPPPYWRATFPDWNNFTLKEFNILDERFQAWMRPSVGPNFIKPYGRNDSTTLKKGLWLLNVVDEYSVLYFNGAKSIIISTLTPMGRKSDFLGGVYLFTGTFSIVLSVIFTIIHLRHPRMPGDYRKLSFKTYNTM